MNYKETIEALLQKRTYQFDDLKDIMTILRSECGCPWDREQTHKSIRSCLIEETYEVVEAIDTECTSLLREELGDVLFQIMFHSQIESEKNEFSVDDVVNDICVKMIHRHPHVFMQGQALSSAKDVVERWENIKVEEKQRKTTAARLRSIPPMLPALMRAEKVASKAGLAQFVSDDQTEIRELADALFNTNEEERTTALGELLMKLAVYADAHEIDAEFALGQAVERQIQSIEQKECKF